MMKAFYSFERDAGEEGRSVTVSKTDPLPEGDFQIDEFTWPVATLWFVTDHDFTESERQQALRALLDDPEMFAIASGGK